MAETAAAVPGTAAWPYVPCGCHGCVSKTLADGTVCPCPECQPGPGLDMHRVRIQWNRRNAEKMRRRIRLSELLAKAELTQNEDAELVCLLDELTQPDEDWRSI